MRVVKLEALVDKLSEYIKLAAAGETVLVTDQDVVVAELGPPRGSSNSIGQDSLLDDARRGLVRPATHTGRPSFTRRPTTSLDELLRELREDRDAR